MSAARDAIRIAIATWPKAVTWDGASWRPYKTGDEDTPGAVIAREFRGSGQLDPRFVVITTPASRDVIAAMHRQYRVNDGHQDNYGAVRQRSSLCVRSGWQARFRAVRLRKSPRADPASTGSSMIGDRTFADLAWGAIVITREIYGGHLANDKTATMMCALIAERLHRAGHPASVRFEWVGGGILFTVTPRDGIQHLTLMTAVV